MPKLWTLEKPHYLPTIILEFSCGQKAPKPSAPPLRSRGPRRAGGMHPPGANSRPTGGEGPHLSAGCRPGRARGRAGPQASKGEPPTHGAGLSPPPSTRSGIPEGRGLQASEAAEEKMWETSCDLRRGAGLGPLRRGPGCLPLWPQREADRRWGPQLRAVLGSLDGAQIFQPLHLQPDARWAGGPSLGSGKLGISLPLHVAWAACPLARHQLSRAARQLNGTV